MTMETRARSCFTVNSLVMCLYPAQLLGDRRRHPVGLDVKLGQDDLRRIVTRQAGYVAARMAARSTQVETGQLTTVSARAWEWPVVANLTVGESADQEIALVLAKPLVYTPGVGR
jgi:hypothetical protein